MPCTFENPCAACLAAQEDPATLNQRLSAAGLRSDAIGPRPLGVSPYAKRIVRVSDGAELFVGKAVDTSRWLTHRLAGLSEAA